MIAVLIIIGLFVAYVMSQHHDYSTEAVDGPRRDKLNEGRP